jgi:putative FmdB family regulatory protein
MPIYTYRCSNCGVQFEKQQSFYDQSLIRCPECGKHALKKVYLPVGIVFKGSGFYATDHHSPSGQSSTAPDNGDQSASESNATGKPSSEKTQKSEEKPAKQKDEEKLSAKK